MLITMETGAPWEPPVYWHRSAPVATGWGGEFCCYTCAPARDGHVSYFASPASLRSIVQLGMRRSAHTPGFPVMRFLVMVGDVPSEPPSENDLEEVHGN